MPGKAITENKNAAENAVDQNSATTASTSLSAVEKRRSKRRPDGETERSSENSTVLQNTKNMNRRKSTRKARNSTPVAPAAKKAKVNNCIRKHAGRDSGSSDSFEPDPSNLTKPLPSHETKYDSDSSELDVPDSNKISNQLRAHHKNQLKICIPAGEQPEKEEYGEKGYLTVRKGSYLNGRYKLVKYLAFGEYSTVWMALDTETDTHVALKIGRCDKAATKSLMKEITFGNAIHDSTSHLPGANNFVRLLGDFVKKTRNGDHVVMVFEIAGPNLNHILEYSNQKKLSVDRLRKFCREMLTGIDLMHTKSKILHGDLKPENILLALGKNDIESMIRTDAFQETSYDIDLNDPDCKVGLKIADFGISLWLDETTNRTIQTCYYRAPEAILRAKVSSATDMWSFGCIAYELATRKVMCRCNTKLVGQSHADHHLSTMTKLFGPINMNTYEWNPDTENPFPQSFKEDGSFVLNVEEPNTVLRRLLARTKSMNVATAELFFDFLKSIMKLDPKERLTAKDALNHPFLTSDEDDSFENSSGKKVEHKNCSKSASTDLENHYCDSSSGTPQYEEDSNEIGRSPTYSDCSHSWHESASSITSNKKQNLSDDSTSPFYIPNTPEYPSENVFSNVNESDYSDYEDDAEDRNETLNGYPAYDDYPVTPGTPGYDY